MNQVKPYLLWIIAGALFLVLVILMAVVTPTVELDGSSKNAYEVKQILDQEAKKLKALAKRARNGDPPGVYNPEFESDIRKLTNDYLLTDRWQKVINPHVVKYGEQLAQIREELRARSAVLTEPVARTSDLLQWYTPYQKLTGELVAQLREAGCLVLPEVKSSATRSVAHPPAGFPGMPPELSPDSGATATGGEVQTLDPERSATLRSLVGLYTSAGDLPAREQHPLLTARFRIAEVIAKAVLASTAETLPNPVIAGAAPPPAPAAIAGWEWLQTSEPLDPPVGSYAEPWRFTVTLQGSESALIAALANIESLERPVLIVLGSTLSRIDRMSPGARTLHGPKGATKAASARLQIDVLVLDFTAMPELVPGEPVPVRESASPGMPDMMPGGFPGGMPFPGDFGGQPLPTVPGPPQPGGGGGNQPSGED